MRNGREQNVKIGVDEKINLQTLAEYDVSEKYVKWLNDYEVTKYTEQKHFEHTLESTLDFVNLKRNSKNDLLFGIFCVISSIKACNNIIFASFLLIPLLCI